MPDFQIRLLQEADILPLFEVFCTYNWTKPQQLFELYWQEQQEGERTTWVCCLDNQLAGYITLKRTSAYPPFQQQGIPEIKDLNVLPPFRQKGLGRALITQAETAAQAEGYAKIGIGVGIYASYAAAHYLYLKKGYLPDGQGITQYYQSVEYGQTVILDDELILWFIKDLS